MRRASSSFGASLIEIIVAVALFSVVAAYCVQIFAWSTTLSHESADLSAAVLLAESVAESLRGSDTVDGLSESLGAAVMTESHDDAESSGFISGLAGFTVYYDTDGNPVGNAENAAYIVYGEPAGGSGVPACDISVRLPDGDEIYAIRVATKEALS